jgi:hypothetical protein
LDTDTGDSLWRNRESLDRDNGLIVWGDRIFASKNGKMIILSASTGEIIKETELLASRMVIADGRIITTVGKDVVCYKPYEKNDTTPGNGNVHQEEPQIKDETILKFKIGNTQYTVNSDNKSMDVAPDVYSGRTMLPARYVLEPLGGQTSWDGTQRKVRCTLGNITVDMWIGGPIAVINGEEKQIDEENTEVVPAIKKGRTMVPMRFLAESIGCEVEWFRDTKEIILTYTHD